MNSIEVLAGEILEFIKDNGPVTNSQIEEAFEITEHRRTKIIRYLRYVEEQSILPCTKGIYYADRERVKNGVINPEDVMDTMSWLISLMKMLNVVGTGTKAVAYEARRSLKENMSKEERSILSRCLTKLKYIVDYTDYEE